ncbi:MAG: hypothetical protein Q8L87_06815 [Anaerolineales bacterium]|nr:hypothetical protein [Anaerolineales bacterium]
MPLMIDLCAGLGGASSAFRLAGWDVIMVDNDPAFSPTVMTDVRTWHYSGVRPDFIWASPPCYEFSREFMPWSKTGVNPDMSIFLACIDFIRSFPGVFWGLENTKGAVSWFRPYIGRPRYIYDPYFIWGFLPDPGKVSRRYWRRKSSLGSSDWARRSLIPDNLSHAIFRAVSSQPALL